MKTILLSSGDEVLLDNEDYRRLKSYTWGLVGGYAARWVILSDKSKKCVLMHREIVQPPEGMQVDHINRDRFDNRRANLRVCTHAENMRNRSLHKNNKSGVPGVCWHKSKGKWQVQVRMDGKLHFFGFFDDKEEAIQVRNNAVRRLHGEFARCQ